MLGGYVLPLHTHTHTHHTGFISDVMTHIYYKQLRRAAEAE